MLKGERVEQSPTRKIEVANYSIKFPQGRVVPAYTKELIFLWMLDHTNAPKRRILSSEAWRVTTGGQSANQNNFRRFTAEFMNKVNLPDEQPVVVAPLGQRLGRAFWYTLADDVAIRWADGLDFGPDRLKRTLELKRGQPIPGFDELEARIITSSRHKVRNLEDFMERVLGRAPLPNERDEFIQEVLRIRRGPLSNTQFTLVPVLRRPSIYQFFHIEGYRLERQDDKATMKGDQNSGSSESERESRRRSIIAARNVLTACRTIYPQWLTLTDGFAKEVLDVNPEELIVEARIGLEYLLDLQRAMLNSPSPRKIQEWEESGYQQLVDMIPAVMATIPRVKNIMKLVGGLAVRIRESKRTYLARRAITYSGPPIDGQALRRFNLPRNPLPSF